jgi:hypothetical protein
MASEYLEMLVMELDRYIYDDTFMVPSLVDGIQNI